MSVCPSPVWVKGEEVIACFPFGWTFLIQKEEKNVPHCVAGGRPPPFTLTQLASISEYTAELFSVNFSSVTVTVSNFAHMWGKSTYFRGLCFLYKAGDRKICFVSFMF